MVWKGRRADGLLPQGSEKVTRSDRRSAWQNGLLSSTLVLFCSGAVLALFWCTFGALLLENLLAAS